MVPAPVGYLFAILVRDQQWANFEEKSLRYDDPNIPSFRLMVDHLQGQYLLKVLRPDNRITLLPVAVLTDQINVGWEPSNSNQRTLADFVNNLVHEGLKFRGRLERRLVGELLLRQRIRTVLQVMSLGRRPGAAGGGDMPARLARSSKGCVSCLKPDNILVQFRKSAI